MKKKLLILGVLSFLCSGCTIGDVARLINPSISPPVISLDPIPNFDKTFRLPNNGKGLAYNQFFSSYSDFDDFSYVEENIKNTATNIDELLTIYENFERNNYHENNDYSGKYQGYNVINILSETLELRFAHPLLTPTLWKVMEASMYFENFYSDEYQQGATCNSEFMSLSGLFPVNQGSWGANMCTTASRNHNFKFSLPAQLKANDYDTYYFHNGKAAFYGRNTFMDKYGFSLANNEVKFLEDLSLQTYLMDEDSIVFFEQFLDFDKYRDGSKNFSVNFLTYSLHGGYDEGSLAVPENIEGIFELLGVPENYFNGHKQVLYYLAKLRSYDKLIAKLIDLVNRQGIGDKTIITIYRDHHPYMMNKASYNWYLNEVLPNGFEANSIERFKHPLLIFEPNNLEKEKEVISFAGATVDLAPTLLNLLGVQANYRNFHGVDILSGESLAFLSSQGLSSTAPLVTNGQGLTFEISNPQFEGDDETGEFYMRYALKKISQLNDMVEIIKSEYFNYFYYLLPLGKYSNPTVDFDIEIKEDSILVSKKPIAHFYYTADYKIFLEDGPVTYEISFGGLSEQIFVKWRTKGQSQSYTLYKS